MTLLGENARQAVEHFVRWLSDFGETSQDHQDFYAQGVGRKAKSLYYRTSGIGTLAVAPMVLCEAFLPQARRFFFHRTRLPIADAHYAMGFLLLAKAWRTQEYLDRAVHFLKVLEDTRCAGFDFSGWGYPFDWTTSNGVIPAGTPLITSTPYCFEAFESAYDIDGRKEWLDIVYSAAMHCLKDYRDIEIAPNAFSCSYTPFGGEGVVNASAYRAFVLFAAWKRFGEDLFRKVAARNLEFVLFAQRADGSWPYAVDGRRDFIDHFHTCFVLKALAKIQGVLDSDSCAQAIRKGVGFYVRHLFNQDGLPRPFSRPPRLTLYRRELYDYAEALNLGVLLGDQFPDLQWACTRTATDFFRRWIKKDGSFRSRELLLGWDNVPMHRWGQSMMFRSLCLMVARPENKRN